MLIYVIATLISMFLAYFAINIRNKKNNAINIKKLFMILSGIPLFIVSGFRYMVGCDYLSYANYFINYQYTTVHRMEFGFNKMIELIQLFSDNYIWIFIITSLIFIYFTYKAIYEQSINPILSIYLLFASTYFSIYLNGMRQMMAIAIFIYSIKFIKERNLLKYLLFILIASLFHLSILICIPLYFLYNIKVKPHIVVIISVIVLFFKSFFYNILTNIFMQTDYSIYKTVFETTKANNIIIIIELFTLIFALLFYNKNKMLSNQKEYNFFLILKLLAFITSLFNGTIPLIGRIRWIFGFSIIIFIPMIIDRINNKKVKLLITLVIIFFFSVYIYYSIVINNSHCVLPYRLIF